MSRLHIDVIGDQQIVDHGLQDLVHFAGRRQQADFLQTLDGVVFGLALPHALGDHGSRVGGHVALIFYGLRENPPESE